MPASRKCGAGQGDLRLLEASGQIDGEMSEFRQQVLAEFNQHRADRRRVDNLKTDLSVAAAELLGLIRDLRQQVKGLEEKVGAKTWRTSGA